MYFTWLDNNSWLLELGSLRILIDPWLVDVLSFGNIDWFFKGSRSQDLPIPENIDLILLSQGLADHAHVPTLKQLDRNIPVIGSPNATKVVQDLGYTNVTTLAHGDSYKINNLVEIKAFPGSPIGPTTVENSYLIQELATGLKVYYEPHGYHSPQLKEIAPVDVIITPVFNIVLPLVGAIIQGSKSTLKVAEWLKPQYIFPTANAQETTYEGLLAKILKIEGSIADLQSLLQNHNLTTQVLEPKVGDRRELNIEKRTLTI